jgi:hypothetical protein
MVAFLPYPAVLGNYVTQRALSRAISTRISRAAGRSGFAARPPR